MSKRRKSIIKSEDIILTDAQWASIMIEQLLNNALKYAKGKDIWIDFDVANQTLQIKDNGIGISKADIPKILIKDTQDLTVD